MDILNKINQILENSISFNQGYQQFVFGGFDFETFASNKIFNLLAGFNLHFIEADMDVINQKFNVKDAIKAWYIKDCSKKELYMKFTSLGFNPPGGVVIEKSLLHFNNIFIAILEDEYNAPDCYVILVPAESYLKVKGAG